MAVIEELSWEDYHLKKIKKLKKDMHIRAVWHPEKQKMSYYFGYLEMDYIGSSKVINGCFVMSSTLKAFVHRMRLR